MVLVDCSFFKLYCKTQCWTHNTNATAIPAIILSVMVLLAVVAVVFYRRYHEMPLTAEISVPLIGLGFVAVFLVVFWSLAVVDNTTSSETVELSSKLQWVMFWADKVGFFLAKFLLYGCWDF